MNKEVAVVILENTIQRKQGQALEQNQNGALKVISFGDVVPEQIKGKFGTFKITIEFDPLP